MPPQPQGGQQDNSMSMLWWIAAIFAVIGLIWYTFKKYLILFYLTIKLYEVDFLRLFLGSRVDDLHTALTYAIQHVSQLAFKDILMLGHAVGMYVKYPIAMLLILLAVLVYFGNTARVFRRIYNMRSMIKLEKTNWPQITPIADIDVLKMDLDKGPWAMAMQPMQFCKRFGLLQEVRPERREGMTKKEWDKIEVVLKRGETNRLFALQLGRQWQGTKALPPHVRALFAVFAARINSDSQDAAKMLAQFAMSSRRGKIDTRGVDDLLKKHENSKLVQKVTGSHAYVYTVMAAMLEAAREDGVQASADFIWLKPMDRRMWYTLNTVGRQTPFVEVAGIFAHWVAEKEAGRKLIVPMIDEATKALEIALKEVIYKRDE